MLPPSDKQQGRIDVQGTTLPPINVNGVVPHIITRRLLDVVLGGQTSLVDRLLWAARHAPELGWLDIYRFGSKGKETLIWRESADRACARILLHSEMPPELPRTSKCAPAKPRRGAARFLGKSLEEIHKTTPMKGITNHHETQH